MTLVLTIAIGLVLGYLVLLGALLTARPKGNVLGEAMPDDFRMMAEVLRRRFGRVAKLRSDTGALSLDAVGADEVPEENGTRPRDAGWAIPDLVIVDGGKGQLNVAVRGVEDLGPDDDPERDLEHD